MNGEITNRKEMPQQKKTSQSHLDPPPETTLHTGAPLYLASKKVSAAAYIFDNQFVVKKGSQMCPVERKSYPPRVKKTRDVLVQEGKVANYIFVADTTFSSPSAAAAVILGGESNGLTLWRNKNGKTLKELNAK